MKRVGPWLILAFLVALGIVVVLRVRLAPSGGLRPAAESPFPLPDSLPQAPDLDSIPGDSLFYGALQRHREATNALFAGDASPLDESERAGFRGLRFFPADPGLRLRVPLSPPDRRDMVTLLDTKGEERTYERFGFLKFRLAGEAQQLTLFHDAGHGHYFLPFRDATSGKESYGMGRYVEPVEEAAGKWLIDFNRAYNPYCAYSDRWSCPIPPDENRITVAVRAGEMKYHPES